MRIELRIEGGFAHIPGLAGPIVVDGAQLEAPAADDLRRLCAAVGTLPETGIAMGLASLPDTRRYRLVIDADGTRRKMTAADPIASPALARLIEFVRAHGKASR